MIMDYMSCAFTCLLHKLDLTLTPETCSIFHVNGWKSFGLCTGKVAVAALQGIQFDSPNQYGSSQPSVTSIPGC